MNDLSKFKPGVPNYILLFLAGMMWLSVGIMLLMMAFSWLSDVSNFRFLIFTGSGIASALLAHHFGFLKIVDKNLKRILRSKDQKCLFAFIPWKSYLIIAVMISLGAFLRHSAIPKADLAVLYIAIGLALVLSSIRYIRIFIKTVSR